MSAALWKQPITSKAWREALAAYDENLQRCSGKNSKGRTLVTLDQWHSNLASTLKSRGHMTDNELSLVMCWKLTIGRWRPLQKMADAHSAATVEKTTKTAFAQLDKGSLDGAMKTLVALRGVGPATASAVLSAYSENVPFMQDEALMAVNGERKYTMRAYKDLCAAINKKILNSDWTSRMVIRALWSAFASAGKQRTKVGALPKLTVKSLAAFDAYTRGAKKRRATASAQESVAKKPKKKDTTAEVASVTSATASKAVKPVEESDEEMVKFNKEHYPNGLNHNFDAKVDVLFEKYGNVTGKFENVESRDIARYAPEIVNVLGKLRGLRVCDAGCGTGLFLPLLARAVGRRGHVVGIDPSDGFVEISRRVVADQKLGNVRVSKCTDKSLELPEGSVDVVFMCDVYHHLLFPRTFLRSMWQALAPGGRFFLLDFYRDESVHKSHPPGWITAHVRAGQSTFRAEVEGCGYKYERDVKLEGLDENYIMLFTKPSAN